MIDDRACDFKGNYVVISQLHVFFCSQASFMIAFFSHVSLFDRLFVVLCFRDLDFLVCLVVASSTLHDQRAPVYMNVICPACRLSLTQRIVHQFPFPNSKSSFVMAQQDAKAVKASAKCGPPVSNPHLPSPYPHAQPAEPKSLQSSGSNINSISLPLDISSDTAQISQPDNAPCPCLRLPCQNNRYQTSIFHLAALKLEEPIPRSRNSNCIE